MLDGMNSNLNSLLDLSLDVAEPGGDEGGVVNGEDVEAGEQMFNRAIDNFQMVIVILDDFDQTVVTNIRILQFRLKFVDLPKIVQTHESAESTKSRGEESEESWSP